MKRFHILFAVILLLLQGCSLIFGEKPPQEEDNPVDPPEETTEFSFKATVPMYEWMGSDTYIPVGPDGGSLDAKVVTDMSSWEVIAPKEDWVTVNTYEGSIWFIIYIDPNRGDEKRRVEIEVIGHDGSQQISNVIRIEQRGGYYEPKLPEEVDMKLMSSATYVDPEMATFIDAADTSQHMIWFREDIPESMVPSGREFIVCPVVREDLPCGAIGRINHCSQQPDGRTCVTYTPCEIQQVFKELNIQTESLDLGEHVIKIIDADGQEIPMRKTRDSARDKISIHMDEHTFRNWDQTIIVKAAVDMEIDLAMNLQIFDNAIQYFAFAIKPDIKLDLDMEVNVQTDFVDERYPFFTVVLGGFPVGPVVITPLIECSFVIGADGKIALHTTVKYRNDNEIRFGYQRGENNFWTVSPNKDVMKGESKTTGEIYAEGTISAGLDESAGLGVYGTILYVTVGVQERIKCGGHLAFDVDKLSKAEGLLTSADAYFFTDATFQGVGALNSLGKTYASVKTLESKIRLDSLYVYPTIRLRCTDVGSRQATLELEAGRDLLLPADIGIDVYGIGPDGKDYQKWYDYDWWDPEENGYIKTSYTIGEQYRLPSVPTHFDEYSHAPVNLFTFDLPVNIPSGYYVVQPWFSIAGGPKVQYGNGVSFNAESGAESAFKLILKDLAKSIPGELPYKWDTNEAIAGWSGVDISYKDAKTPYMTVTFRGGGNIYSNSAGSLSGEVHVGNHTAGLNCGWTINYRAQDGAPTVLDIQDENFDGFSQDGMNLSGGVYELNLNSKKKKSLDCLGYGWPVLETLVLKGDNSSLTTLSTGNTPSIRSINLANSSALTTLQLIDCPNLTKLEIANKSKVDNVKLKDAGAGMDNAFLKSLVNLKTLNLENVKVGESLTFDGLSRLENIDFTGEIFENVTLRGCFATGASVSQVRLNSKNVTLDGCNLNYFNNHDRDFRPTTFESVTVRGCEKLTEIRLERFDLLRKVTLSDLPSLGRAFISDCSMEEFEMSGVPVIYALDITGNHIPRQVVPPLFDQIRLRVFDTEYAKGGNMAFFNASTACDNIQYDEVYFYYDQNHYSESDYGFYYPDEPDCGFHWFLSRIGRQPEY